MRTSSHKNTSGEIFERHGEKMVVQKSDVESKIKEGCWKK